VLAPTALAGPDWVEDGDAGSGLATAQITVGQGGIRSIFGTLSSAVLQPDFEDMYIIRIESPSIFTFTLSNATYSPAVFLFNISQANEAFGLLGKLADGGSGVAIGNSASDSTGALIAQPGLYALAITFEGNFPRSRTGDIFAFNNEGETSGADGPGGLNPLQSWDPTQPFGGGDYLVGVQGVDFAQVPSPAALALFGLAGAAGLRRRR
jgi:MYXO-CTERM domain-containing protein